MKQTVIKFGIIVASIGLSTLASATTPFSSNQQEQIQKIVHDYLVTNPQVLIEASAALQKQQNEQAQKAALATIQANKDSLFRNTSSPVYGNPKGNITVVEFYDYQCGHCKAMTSVIDRILADNKNIRVISKDMPIFGKNSLYAAKASIAAFQLNAKKYHQLHNELMEKSDPLDTATINNIIKQNGYDLSKINTIVNAQSSNVQINQTMRLAQDMKLRGTPAFIIANKDLTRFEFVPGATSATNLQAIINSLQ